MKRVVRWVSKNFWPLLPALIGLAAVGVLAAGCGAWTTQTPWPVKSPMHAKGTRSAEARARTAAAPVEQALHGRGVRFGTDGSVESLYAYAKGRHESLDPRQARLGDLLFFDITPRGDSCGSHVGMVTGIAPGGALKFTEWREGLTRESLVDPMRPTRRRDEHGRVINTFMRARQPGDDGQLRYYAGEMLCAVIRVR